MRQHSGRTEGSANQKMLFVVFGEPECGTLPKCHWVPLHQSISASAVSPPKTPPPCHPPPFSSFLDLSLLSCLAASLPCVEREEAEEDEGEEEDDDKKKLVATNLIFAILTYLCYCTCY